LIFVGKFEEVYPVSPAATYAALMAEANSEAVRRQGFSRLWAGKLEPREMEEATAGSFWLPVRYTLAIKEMLHGEPSARIEIFTGSGDADCSVKFEAGKEYLVFAYRVGQRWATNICTGTGAVTERRVGLEQLRALRDGKAPGRRVVGFAHPADGGIRPEVRLQSESGTERRIVADTRGWFEFVDLTPGRSV
jgi:hypothetical protein